MAEASSLVSKIDENFLQCGICFEPFRDPRGLPCLHTFCCECLIHWARSCSKDRRTVSCPLCKKVCQVPEDGVTGFPSHFYVTSLREAVDTERKTRINTEFCEEHCGELKRNFCDTCGIALCPDCCAFDIKHRGHKFIRLKDAAKKQASFLRDLIKQSELIEERYESAIKESQQIDEALEHASITAKDEVDAVGKEVLQQVERLIKTCKQDIDNKKEERVKVIGNISERLQVALATIKSICQQGTDVVNSGSEYEITQVYPSVSRFLQNVATSQPNAMVAANRTLSHIKFEPSKVEIKSIGRLMFEKQENRTSGEYLEDTRARDGTTLRSSSSSTTAPFQRQRASISKPMPTGHMESRSYKIRTKRWAIEGEITTSPVISGPRGIATLSSGDIAVTGNRNAAVITMAMTCTPLYKGRFPVHTDITTTPNGIFVVTDEEEFYMYDRHGDYIKTIDTCDIDGDACKPNSVAADSQGRIIIGSGYGHNTISIHDADGLPILKFATRESPRKLACTPNDNLVISFNDDSLAIMDQSGHLVSDIQPPPGREDWRPWYVCCSKGGELYVSDWANGCMYQYVSYGKKYIPHRMILDGDCNQHGIALSADEKRLFVVIYRDNEVLVLEQ